MMRRRRTAIYAALAVGAVLAAGCSSSAASSSGGGAAASGAAAKTPIRLMVDTVMTPSAAFGGLSFPYPATGAEAAAAALNKTGGIDGHPIQIDACDNQGNPNQSAACGREAKSNGDIAVIGSFDIEGAAEILPVLQSEGIPYVGALAGSAVELSNPDSFIFDPGAVLAAYGTAALFAQQGCKTVVEFALADTPGFAQELAGQQAIAAKDGYKLETVNVSVGQTDVSAPVSTALSMHPDCVSYEGDGQTTAKLVGAVRQAGFSGKFITAIGSLLPPFLASLGAVGNGVVVLNSALNPANSTDPLVTEFRNQITSYVGAKNAPTDLNEFAQDGWSSVRLVDLALSGTGTYTAAELLKKLPTMCDVNVGNVYPNVDFCKPAVQSTVYPRVFNTYVQYFVAKNGQYVPLDNKWYNIADTVPTSS
jgi:branched-chain amino acid transport system substrate-binding protein